MDFGLRFGSFGYYTISSRANAQAIVGFIDGRKRPWTRFVQLIGVKTGFYERTEWDMLTLSVCKKALGIQGLNGYANGFLEKIITEALFSGQPSGITITSGK